MELTGHLRNHCKQDHFEFQKCQTGQLLRERRKMLVWSQEWMDVRSTVSFTVYSVCDPRQVPLSKPPFSHLQKDGVGPHSLTGPFQPPESIFPSSDLPNIIEKWALFLYFPPWRYTKKSRVPQERELGKSHST